MKKSGDPEKIISALAGRVSAEFAADLYGKGLFRDLKYVSFFTFYSLFDRDVTLRVVYLDKNGKPLCCDTTVGARVAKILSKPAVLNDAARKLGASFSVAAMSAPAGYGIAKAYKAAERMFSDMKTSELYDFLLIEKGDVISLIRSWIPRDEI